MNNIGENISIKNESASNKLARTVRRDMHTEVQTPYGLSLGIIDKYLS